MSWDIRHGDLFKVLKSLDDESVDACVTDPPYGIGFMGREWDTFKPGIQRESKRAAWDGGALWDAMAGCGWRRLRSREPG